MSIRRSFRHGRLAATLAMAFLLANFSLVLHDYVLSAHQGQDSCEICLVGGAHGAALAPTPTPAPLPVASAIPVTPSILQAASRAILPYAARAPPRFSRDV